ncbi:T-lymphocyte surface antigen Ly-9-like isoform 2-T2 [Anableps anableps]
MALWAKIFLPVLLTTAAAETTPQLVRGKPGKDVTLDFGVLKLKDTDWVVWSRDSNSDVLAKHIENIFFIASERFQLDTETGSLTIRNLSVHDAGRYQGQVINRKKTQRHFNLTVEEPVPSPVPAETSPGRTYWFALAALSLSVLLIAVLVGLSLRCSRSSTCLLRIFSATSYNPGLRRT